MPARRTHRRGPWAAAAIGRRRSGSREARGGGVPAVGRLTGGGEASSGGGVGDRGGRATVEDGVADSDHPVPRRGRLWLPGGLDWGMGRGGGGGVAVGEEFNQRPRGGSVLVADDWRLPRRQYSRGGGLRGRVWWGAARRRLGCAFIASRRGVWP